MQRLTRYLISLIGLTFIVVQPASAQPPDAAIEVVQIVPGIAMLRGRGGNIGVSYGDDGVLLIDDQYAPATEAILAAVATFSDQPVRFVINTHWHGDHTGGNESLGKSGAVIVAHENVRKRLSSEQFMAAFQRTVPPSPPAALPVVTFASDVTLHLNGIDIQVQHVDPAHTDGDSVVRFGTTNVVHMGDTYFNGMYPFFDMSSGGKIEGMLKAVETVLARIDDDAVIIPGHGLLSNKRELRAYVDMLGKVIDRVRKGTSTGMSVDQIVAAKPTADLDPAWAQGHVEPDQFVRWVAQSLARP